MRHILQKLLTIQLILLLPAALCAESLKSYTFGVFPHLPRHKLYETYLPVTENFSKVLNTQLTLKTQPSFSQFENVLKEEQFDIALIQPFDFIEAYDNQNYLPIARRSDPLSSILVVKKDAPFKSLQDLKGKRIANPPESAAVTRLTDRTMKQAGFDPHNDFVRVYINNHFSCMQSVLINKADACGTSLRAMYHYEDDMLNHRLKIVHESEAIPHVLYVAHKRVPKAHRDILKQTILNWQNTPEGRDILKASRMSRFSEASSQEYEILR